MNKNIGILLDSDRDRHLEACYCNWVPFRIAMDLHFESIGMDLCNLYECHTLLLNNLNTVLFAHQIASDIDKAG